MSVERKKRARLFTIDDRTGLPVGGVPISLWREWEEEDQEDPSRSITRRNVLGIFASDAAGYASVPVPVDPSDRIIAIPLGEPSREIDISDLSDGGIGSPAVPVRVSPAAVIDLSGRRELPSIVDPLPEDWIISPGSFASSGEIVLGEKGCEELLISNVAERTFRFSQLIRDPATDPEEFARPTPGPCDPYDEFQESARVCYRRGVLLEYEMLWKPLGHGLGEVLYSLPLAPCESVNLAIIDWSRTDEVVRGEQTAADEQLLHRQRRDRVVDEAVEATVSEWQEGDSFLGGTGGAGGYGQGMWGVSGTHALGIGSASSYGRRNVVGETTQRLADSVVQATSSLRRFHSTVVVQATQAERDRVETRTVTNHNHCHAMTVLYYQVVRHYLVTTRLVRKRDAVLVDYRRKRHEDESRLVPNFHGFDDLSVIHQYRLVLEPALLDSRLQKCFEALARLQCARREWEASRDRLPVEEIELDTFEMRIHTSNETGLHQRVELITRYGDQIACRVGAPVEYPAGTFDFSHEGEYLPRNVDATTQLTRSGDADLFTLKPVKRVRWSDIEAIRIHVEGLPRRSYADTSSWEIERLRSFTRSGTAFWMMYDGPGGTVSLDEALTLDIIPFASARSPEELLTEEERCCIAMLVEHLKAHKWHYNRAIWLAEHPDERASRFENLAFSVGGESGRLIDFIENKPVGVIGHYVAFPVFGSELADQYVEDVDEAKPEKRVLSVPTRGLFAEAKLSHCNSCEKRDVTRFWDWQKSPCPRPPMIEGIRPGTRHTARPIAPAAPEGRLGVETPPTAPEPGAMLQGVLDLLGKSDIFRDMSGMEQLGPLLQTLVEGAVELEKARMQNAPEMEKAGQEEGAPSEAGTAEQGDAERTQPRRRTTTTTDDRGTRRVEHPTPEEIVDTTRALEDARERGVDTLGEMGVREEDAEGEERPPRYSSFQIQITDISVPFGFGDEREVTVNGRLRVLSGYTADDEPVAGSWYSFVYQGSGTVYGTEIGRSSSDPVSFSLPAAREFPTAFEDARARVSALGVSAGVGLMIEVLGASFRVPLTVDGPALFGFETTGIFTNLTREE